MNVIYFKTFWVFFLYIIVFGDVDRKWVKEYYELLVDYYLRVKNENKIKFLNKCKR